MTKETYHNAICSFIKHLRGMTEKEWEQLMHQYDIRIAEEKKELEEREKMFDESRFN